MRSRKSIVIAGLCICSLCFISACQKEEPPKVVPPAPVVVEEPSVIKELPDEEAAKLINQVREYAEAFDIGLVDQDIRILLRASIDSGSQASSVRDQAHEIVLPYMEEQLKERIAEGLQSIMGSASEEDIEEIYGYMDPEDLVSFIVDYEIERLKMEGYLR